MSTKIYEICKLLSIDHRENLNTSIGNSFLNLTPSSNVSSLREFIQNFCDDMPSYLVKLKLDSERANIIKLVYPFILIFGIFGNLLSLLVMTKITKRGINYQKFSFSLAVLSIADLGKLLKHIYYARVNVIFYLFIQNLA